MANNHPHAATAPPHVAAAGEITESQRTYATFLHLAPLLAHFALPALGGILVALVMWQIKADQSPFLDDHGKEAVNFQITIALYLLVSGLMVLVLIGFLLLPAVFVLMIAGGALAARAGNQGRYHRYPMSLRFIR